MDGIAAKIAEKIFMLFQNQDFNARSREQKSQHHPGGPAANDAATGVDCFVLRCFRVVHHVTPQVPTQHTLGKDNGNKRKEWVVC